MKHYHLLIFLIFIISCDKNDSDNTKQSAKDYFELGNEAYKNQNLEEAKKHYKLAIKNDTTTDAYKVSQYYTGLIGVYLFQNKYGDALAEIQEFENKKLKPQSEKELFSLSVKQNIFLEAKNLMAADSINKLLLEKSRFYKDTFSEVEALIAKLDLLQIKNLDNEYLKLVNKLTDSSNISDLRKADIFNRKGIYHFYNKDFKEAIENYKTFLDYYRDSESSGASYHRSIAYANIAEANIELNEYEKARVYLDSFYSIDQRLTSNNLKNSVFKYELRMAHKTNDNSRIEMVIDSYAVQQEQFYKDRYTKELQLLSDEKIKSENLLKQQQQTEIDKLKIITYSSIALLVLIIVIGIISFTLFKNKKEQMIQSLNNQQRLLRAQMNPHFIFNVIGKIQHLLKQGSNSSVSYLTKFSRLLRNVLHNSMENYVLLEDEIQVLEDYLNLQQLRFPSLFDFKISVNPLLLDEFVKIPPMLIQPFVENSIEHGFNGIDYMGFINVTIEPVKRDDISTLICIIGDNGVGFEKSLKNPDSVSLKLISNFIKKSTGQELSIIKDEGTTVSFLIKTT